MNDVLFGIFIVLFLLFIGWLWLVNTVAEVQFAREAWRALGRAVRRMRR